MYTLNGMTVSEGVGAGPALIMNKTVSIDSQDEEKVFDSESEIAKFKKASNEFATRLHQVTAGPAPDSVRDLFGAAAGFITNSKNVDAIISLILSGASAAKAAKIILFENLKAFVSLILKTKPSVVKGTYVKNISISTTMGPGIKIDANSFDK